MAVLIFSPILTFPFALILILSAVVPSKPVKKENVNYDWDGTTELKKLKPAKFNFIDEKDTIEGFLAHEVSEVVPLAVTGEKDQVNKDGEPEYQSMDASKLVPLLVKTIQELEARIAKLEGE